MPVQQILSFGHEDIFDDDGQMCRLYTIEP